MEDNRCVKAAVFLGELTHQFMYTVSKQLKEMEVTPEQPILLNIILRHGPLTQKDLADKMHIKPATLTGRLQRLEKKDYIVRTIDQNDKRVQYVEITGLGKDILEKSADVLKNISNIAFDNFEKEEILNLISIIERVQSNLNDFKENL